MEQLVEIKYTSLSKSEVETIDDLLLKMDKDIQIGNTIIDNSSYGHNYEVLDLYLFDNTKKNNDGVEESFKDVKIVVRDYNDRIETKTASEFLKSGYYSMFVFKGSYDQLKEAGRQAMIADNIETPEAPQQTDALISYDKSAFVNLKRDLVVKSENIRATMEMSNLILKKKMNELANITSGMMKEVTRLSKIIWTIELYLGIKENIELIREGTDADIEEPIHLLQERLYMDEEVGDPTNGGLDINSIDKFYDWLNDYSDYFKCENYKLLLPYEKCVRIMRIRRKEKNYGNPFLGMMMNSANFETDILIRNGSNVYSIQTDMVFGDKLFPAEDELMNLSNEIANPDKKSFSRRKTEDDLTDEIDRYKRNFIIVQGLIDRTEVFGNLFGKVNLMNGSALEKEQVKFIYDADYSKQIGDGEKPFLQRLNESNENLSEGSRVLWRRDGGYSSEKDYRFFRAKWNATQFPVSPNSGVYDLLLDGEVKYFMYLPNDEVYKPGNRYNYGTYEKRKQKVAFALRYDGADQAINFDDFSHRDIDWLNLTR